MLKHITAAALLGLTLAAPVAAQTARPGAHPIKPKLMQMRIRQGVRSGQISPDERAAIRQHLQSFRQQFKTMRASGRLTPEQKKTMRQQWRQISRQVFRAKHKR